MKLPHRRQFLHLAAGASALPAVSRIARAQTYPTKPVRVVVGAAPGSNQDIIARLVGQWLSDRLGQQFIIENRPGAGTNVAAEAVVRAPADGYTLLSVSSANAVSATVYKKLKFNFIRDIAPVASILRGIPIRIDAMNLKHRLRDIEADGGNRFHLAPPNMSALTAPTSMALVAPVEEPSTASQAASRAAKKIRSRPDMKPRPG